MKLYFQIQNYNWQPERYKYSVEQMMLMLFPGERPEYPEGYAPSDNEAFFALDRGPDRTVVTARVTRPEGPPGTRPRWRAAFWTRPRSGCITPSSTP